MRKFSVVLVPVTAAALVGLTAPAQAAQGRVEQGPDHAKSLCSYSGLNDDPGAEFPEGGQTQSYGQLVRKGVISPRETRNTGESPGNLCNARNVPLK